MVPLTMGFMLPQGRRAVSIHHTNTCEIPNMVQTKERLEVDLFQDTDEGFPEEAGLGLRSKGVKLLHQKRRSVPGKRSSMCKDPVVGSHSRWGLGGGF